MTAYELWCVRHALYHVLNIAQTACRPKEAFGHYFPEDLLSSLEGWRHEIEPALLRHFGALKKPLRPWDSEEECDATWSEFWCTFKSIDQELVSKLSSVPAGEAKALEALKAGLTSYGQVHPDRYETVIWLSRRGHDTSEFVSKVTSVWRLLQEKQSDPATRVFWPSGRTDEDRFDFYHFHFANYFNVTGYDDIFDEVGSTLRKDLLMEPQYHPELLFLLAMENEVWLHLLPAIKIACLRLAQEQTPDGHWTSLVTTSTDERDYPSAMPDPFKTAVHALFLAKFANDLFSDKVRMAVSWLRDHQERSGCWQRIRHHSQGFELIDDVLTTLFATQAIYHSGMDPAGHATGQAMQWIWSRQDPDGAFYSREWLEGGETTLWVLRTQELVSPTAPPITPLVETALRLFLHGVEHGYSGGTYDGQICVIHLHQALELFLYGCLDLPQINRNYYMQGKQSKRTIGFRKALEQFRLALVELGMLPADGSVVAQDDLERLADLRDGAVHRGEAVSNTDARDLCKRVRAFLTEYCRELLDVPLANLLRH